MDVWYDLAVAAILREMEDAIADAIHAAREAIAALDPAARPATEPEAA